MGSARPLGIALGCVLEVNNLVDILNLDWAGLRGREHRLFNELVSR